MKNFTLITNQMKTHNASNFKSVFLKHTLL